MIKTKVDQKLEGFLKLVKPLSEVKKLKISSHRHPCHDEGDHDVVKAKILAFNLLQTK